MTFSETGHKAVRVLITGASQGIGAAIARQFAKPGVTLLLVARNAGNLQSVARECGTADRVETYACDVAEAEAVSSWATAVTADVGGVDVLINNAGCWHGQPVADMAVDDFDRVVASNLRSVFLMTRAFLPAMQAAGRGDIFNMVSTAGFEGYAGVSAYCAAKHGVLGFSKALREELRDDDIRVCCVSPGPTWSPSWENSHVPETALMPTDDVARAFWNLYTMDRNVVTENMVLRPRQGHISS